MPICTLPVCIDLNVRLVACSASPQYSVNGFGSNFKTFFVTGVCVMASAKSFLRSFPRNKTIPPIYPSSVLMLSAIVCVTFPKSSVRVIRLVTVCIADKNRFRSCICSLVFRRSSVATATSFFKRSVNRCASSYRLDFSRADASCGPMSFMRLISSELYVSPDNLGPNIAIAFKLFPTVIGAITLASSFSIASLDN